MKCYFCDTADGHIHLTEFETIMHLGLIGCTECLNISPWYSILLTYPKQKIASLERNKNYKFNTTIINQNLSFI